MFSLTNVTHPTVDTRRPLLLLQAESGERFLFGQICEGTQRTFPETRMRLSKLENVFLTGQLSWEAVGGLPGMILTLSDQGVKKMNLYYGSDILNYMVATWRYFIFRFGMRLTINTLRTGECFENKALRVSSIVVNHPDHEPITQTLPQQLVQNLRRIVGKMFPQKDPMSNSDPAKDPQINVNMPKNVRMPQTATSYEIFFKPIRGRFKVEEAIKLGVPKGPMFAKLTQGLAVKLADGSEVLPEQVLEKTREFARVLILDIPSDEFLTSSLSKLKDVDKQTLGAVYYFLGEQVSINERLVKVMELLQGPHTQHFVSHPRVCPNNIVFQSAALTTLKLKSALPQHYILPDSNRVFSSEFYGCFNKELPRGTSVSQEQEEPLVTSLRSENVHVMLQQNSISIEPYTAGEEHIKVKISENFQQMKSWEKLFVDHIADLAIPGATAESVSGYQANGDVIGGRTASDKVEVMTLGTGSALPSKYRNVIGMLLRIPYVKNGAVYSRNVLMDAGENTLGSILRYIPRPELPQLFKDLKLVYLSHLHADHHLGIMSLLEQWYAYNENDDEANLYLIVPWQFNFFVKEWCSLMDPGILSKVTFISCEHLIEGNYVRKEIKPLPLDECRDEASQHKKRRLELDDTSSFRNLDSIKQLYRDLNIKMIQTCRAKHCDWAYSCSFTFYMNSDSSRSFKVSYSGDTRPNIDKFSSVVGLDSDLLIHEATLDNDLMEDAIKKRHCTINEAIKVSNAMRARKLILTHFSQRYPKLPQIDKSLEIKAQEFCFAFDGMLVNYDNIGEQFPKLKYLKKAFMEEKNSFENDTSI
ncbi:LAMI_0H09890g1_1 [Lachancea mirantina]|uniref:ribonuclease Z n=1 Tax=Lachancea mirantina TaxID=1230905 RepID=A0A1G4KGM2_9SACH|nr:LAMI_0H09890g1_1 [Lachancea mirantina]